MKANPERIMLVDDEEGLLELLKISLAKERYHHIDTAATGAEAQKKVAGDQYDLIILDVMLPDCSGFDLCLEIRRHTVAPIIFLTACSSDFEKLSGLTLGGDDYITKPFNTIELVARIKAIFRRRKLDREEAATAARPRPIYDYSYFSLDMQRAVLTVNGQQVDCSAKEMELLEFFCRHPCRIFSIADIFEEVWGLLNDSDDKTVIMHISKLRKKLNDNMKPNRIIINMRGLGYKFMPPDGLHQ